MILTLYIFLLNFFFNSQIILYDLDNNEVNISELSDSSFVVFYKSPSCHKCLIELGKAISDKKYKKYAIIQAKDNFYVKVELKNTVGKYIDFDDYFFDVIKSTKKRQCNENSLFIRYNIVNSPALLIYHKGKISYLTFEKLFINYYDVETIKKEILNAINTNQ